MIAIDDMLKRLEIDLTAFKKDRDDSWNDIEWHKLNGVIRYIERLIVDIRREK